MNISLTDKLERKDERMTFSLSPKAQSILGVDDPMLVREAYPSLEFVQQARGQYIYTATRLDARTLCSDLNERSLPGEQGFGHTTYERDVCRSHARRIYFSLYGVLP